MMISYMTVKIEQLPYGHKYGSIDGCEEQNEIVLRKFAKINDILNYWNIMRKECSENLIPTVQNKGKRVPGNNLVLKKDYAK